MVKLRQEEDEPVGSSTPWQKNEAVTQSAAPKPERAPINRRALSIDDFADVKRDTEDGKDNLYIPPEIIPKGIAVEWKRLSVFNKEDKNHKATLHRSGWRFIPADTEGFAEHFAAFISGDIFEYEGVALMYRPSTMSIAAKKEEDRKANALVNDKMEEMGMTTHKDMPRKKFVLSRGYDEPIAGGNPAAIAVPD